MKKALLLALVLAASAASAGAWHGQPGVQGSESVGTDNPEGQVERLEGGPGAGSGVSHAVLGIVQSGERVPLCTVTMRMGDAPRYGVDCSLPAALEGGRFYVTMKANGMTVTG